MRKNHFISLLIILCVITLLSACCKESFEGIRIANEDLYHLDIVQMNETDTHTLKLNAGDKLNVHFKTDSGKIKMEITAPDGTIIYTGNGERINDFAININNSGEYCISVESHNATGSVNIDVTETRR